MKKHFDIAVATQKKFQKYKIILEMFDIWQN